MVGCSFFNFNLVQYRVKRVRAFYRSQGLKSQLIALDNGSTIHCWVQTQENEPERRSWRGQPQMPPGEPLRPPGEHVRPPGDHVMPPGEHYPPREPSMPREHLIPPGEHYPREHSIPPGEHYPPREHLIPPGEHYPPREHLIPPGEHYPPREPFMPREHLIPPRELKGEPHRRMHDDRTKRRSWRGFPRAPRSWSGFPQAPRSWRGFPQAPRREPLGGPPRRMYEDDYKRRSWRGQPQNQSRRSKPLPERPALLFLHGFGADGTVGWEHQIAAFTKDYRVLVPDLLFFGTSTTKNTQRTEIFQADCIKDMLTKLNVQGTHVVGTSYGGFVAFWLAYKYPSLCWKVVLSSSGICMNPQTNEPLLSQCNLTCVEDLLLPTTGDGLKLCFSLVYAKPPGLPDFIVEQIHALFYAQEDRPHRIELLKALVIGSEKCPPLPVLTQEVLIIWGRGDQIFKLPLAYQLQQLLGEKHPQVAVIEGAGHLPQIEKSKEYNTILSNFLADSEGSF